ncbi:ABC transporter ATP-binding protein [Streptobacillus moniliformis]|uniref:Spermidine/putrescine import ATP-binding protein PotA n=1 Tax=Streptobacillus moniliformis (strain ATCC 14647 / DSM 12112 / NCTC 10651 / 9901) TaxID=519441 RepID=D1AWT9_STRM9|nr:ABC transporter ATP-binding protein [Streptobacillus moniliformis]ACZ00765.1 spermidine/putrescine ABC transporter ATPase subunit [Streptobacillus moniliformis DSM 12112]AVL42841.1 polyamine ABC transporter ATP-binding protein [Streptobacillus moniliformis]QXW65519.1 ABC transporter ATP-binding protein [Streptobacillus moniliformis]SQA14105.1 Spermidine/putrescine import ATP-binding protein PotA [Streptobacillus moniliformis]
MSKPIKLNIQNLTKVFTPKGRRVVAVEDVNLEVKEGEFVSLLGPSGCGKTTTLRMIAGFETPSEGHITINDRDIAYLTPDKRGISMVFQNYALFPHMNVYDNIAYGLKIQKRPKEEIKQRVDKILKLMKMEDFAERIPSQMSGGQQQRVSLARALIMDSEVLLFDEPLSNLDAKLRLHMRDEIRKLQLEVGITSIYVTHDQAEAMALSDKIVIMKDGKIAQVGTPQEIYQKPNSEFVAKFIGRANILNAKVLENRENSTLISILDQEYLINETVNYPSGSDIKVVIRPESIKFTEPKHTLEVSKSIFMGENHEYEVKNGDNIIEIVLNNPHGKEIKKVGDKLSFVFDQNSIHIL